jgi:hypothetical protein
LSDAHGLRNALGPGVQLKPFVRVIAPRAETILRESRVGDLAFRRDVTISWVETK